MLGAISFGLAARSRKPLRITRISVAGGEERNRTTLDGLISEALTIDRLAPSLFLAWKFARLVADEASRASEKLRKTVLLPMVARSNDGGVMSARTCKRALVLTTLLVLLLATTCTNSPSHESGTASNCKIGRFAPGIATRFVRH